MDPLGELNASDVIAPVARTREEAERMGDQLERLIVLGNVRRARRVSQAWYACRPRQHVSSGRLSRAPVLLTRALPSADVASAPARRVAWPLGDDPTNHH